MPAGECGQAMHWVVLGVEMEAVFSGTEAGVGPFSCIPGFLIVVTRCSVCCDYFPYGDLTELYNDIKNGFFTAFRNRQCVMIRGIKRRKRFSCGDFVVLCQMSVILSTFV